MEINVTSFVCEADVFQFSHSRMEGGDNAGPNTWNAAKEQAKDAPLLATPNAVEAARDWFGEFGAWDEAERAAWSADEVNALLIQFISGDVREAQALCAGDGPGDIDWEDYQTTQEAGQCSGHLFCTDEGEVYFSLD